MKEKSEFEKRTAEKLMPLLHTFADQLGEGMSGKRKDTPQAAAPRRTVIYKEDLE